MSTLYFKKEIPATPLILDGKPVPFSPICSDYGLITLEAEEPIAQKLTDLSGRRGVVRITQAEYEELKKNPPLNKSDARLSNDRVRVMPSRLAQKSSPNGVAAAKPAEDPFGSIPKDEQRTAGFRARTMKASQIAAIVQGKSESPPPETKGT